MTNSAPSDADLDALANSIFGNPDENGGDGGATATDPVTPPAGEGEEGGESTPGGEGAPAEQATAVLDEATLARVREQLRADLKAEEEAEARRKDVARLLTEGTDEELSKFVRESVTTAQVQATAIQEASKTVYGSLLAHILTPDFVKGLTDEERKIIDPEAYDSDPAYIEGIMALKVSKSSKADVDKLVQERLEAERNQERGKKIATPSATQTPPASEGTAWEGLKGEARQNAIWDEVERELSGATV